MYILTVHGVTCQANGCPCRYISSSLGKSHLSRFSCGFFTGTYGQLVELMVWMTFEEKLSMLYCAINGLPGEPDTQTATKPIEVD